MNISLAWLNNYIQSTLDVQEVSEILTSIGLEVGGVEEHESVRGGLKGLVAGKVLTCIDHPNSDHLHITTVDLGDGVPTQIVCGAPNIAAGQTVVVATLGTTLYSGEDSFTIKKSKIRGEESFGMICSAKEIQVGQDSDGIMVLADDVKAGTPAAELFDLKSDYIIEVDITPNRVDATSHYGVARELHAYLKTHAPEKIVSFTPPMKSVEFLHEKQSMKNPVTVTIDKESAVVRYSGIVIDNLKVAESPEWLRKALEAIGQKPINNVVDVTNYVLHSIGQPLHAFDLDKLSQHTISVRCAKAGEKLLLLSGAEHELVPQDVVIADAERPLCLGGVMGGEDSGVSESTTRIFLESANFNPTCVRKTARRYALNTDSSFRFERGLDPEATLPALVMAAELLKEIAGGEIASPLTDYYPEKKEPYRVDFSLQKLTSTAGYEIPEATVRTVLKYLDINIAKESNGIWALDVPRYRVDVTREIDVIEEVMRIFGYNNIPMSYTLKASLNHVTETDKSVEAQRIIAEMLTGAGFAEILNNSLTSSKFFLDHSLVGEDEIVTLVNPLSSDLNVMRPSMVKGGLEVIDFNSKRKSGPLSLYEYGSVYHRIDQQLESSTKGYREDSMLALWISGDKWNDHWATNNDSVSTVFHLKAYVYNIMRRLGIAPYHVRYESKSDSPLFAVCEEIRDVKGELLARWGRLSKAVLSDADIAFPVFYAELYWDKLYKIAHSSEIKMRSISKFPAVRRDFALLIDNGVSLVDIERVAYKAEKKLLKGITLFDVYEDPKHLPPGKKSYAVAFELQDEEKTLSDKAIESAMERIHTALVKELGASLR
ncbi:phenylalanyl-tRNA synthetase subunit beta [Porphyromonas canoris]|uniref:phenylalanine--tRNA ligase subunit beta n=1 Tax=Porphyromonas canoris TaxID=36875 RepID=UPI00051E091F|nr:phenylalanine--tRNA ligase subunit beta [Porphyromonas canoris]KGL52356.1 phenylalanyl-tRNA synthetase subunit beta [Porphyromonas canoris]